MPYFLGQEEVPSPEEVTAESALLGFSSESTCRPERDIHITACSGQPDRKAWRAVGHRQLPGQPCPRPKPSRDLSDRHVMAAGSLWASHDFPGLGSFIH